MIIIIITIYIAPVPFSYDQMRFKIKLANIDFNLNSLAQPRHKTPFIFKNPLS